MARITVEDCIDKFPSRFELVLVASQRARNLHSGDNPTVEKDNDKNTVIALREIADSTISAEVMKENLIQEYQTVTISDEEENLELENSDNVDGNDSISKASQEIEEELINSVKSEDSEIEDQYEITESVEGSAVQENEDIQKEIDLVKSEDSEIEDQYEITESIEGSAVQENEDIQKES